MLFIFLIGPGVIGGSWTFQCLRKNNLAVMSRIEMGRTQAEILAKDSKDLYKKIGGKLSINRISSKCHMVNSKEL
jgi:hypothetical protein